MGSTTAKTRAEAYCPHCFLLVEQDVPENWPPSATRCPHCRLLIGPGRGRPTAEANPGARGSAAGVFAHQAKREDSDDVSQDVIREAIRRVADELGSRPERLLMVDYQQRASTDQSLPSLSDVFSAFGSWKRARREAAI
jgi:Homing endonuclease associated repeat